MPARAPWRALSVVLILVWGHPRAGLACPHPCACYVPSEVHCTFRSLASVPAGISKHVERINLGFNSIQALSETSLAGLTKLELLMIHGNEIQSIPDGALKDLISLQVFKFSYNKLRVITAQTLQGLWSLLRLHLDHNKIEFIHPQAFSGLTSLRLLHLEGNVLHQLHPDTFSTFSFLDHFRLSTIRHLYLAENELKTLPPSLLQNMPLLENLYLQGNPWSCDCEMKWFLEWDAKSKGILKCKKDKAYEGGQLCATCTSPKKLHRQEIQKLKEVTCQKPLIASPLRQNRSRGSEEEPEQEEDGDDHVSLESLQVPRWNVSLNMSDEHGNTAHLVCAIKKPTDLQQLHLNQTDPQEIELNATLALDFECPMTRENYEKLWKLIAYYSEVPVKLHRDPAPDRDPSLGSQYRQDADDDTLYYTGVRAHILAEPEWVLQPSVDLQLNRRQSTAKTVVLSYASRYSLTMPAKDARPSRSRSWVMIEPSTAVQRAQTVLEGSPCQLSCNVKASERPSIWWVLPDGSVLKAPLEDPDGRVSVLTSGWLKIKSTEPSDAGLYQCIARVRDEVDRMVYRVLVQPPAPQAPDGHTVTIQKNPGEPVTLPCHALAVPEAQISWILPNKRILNDMANTSHAYLLADGTLSIPRVQGSDSGYYRCVAVNQHGADHFTVGVAVHKKDSGRSSKRGRRPGGKTLARGRGDVAEDEGGSGVGEEDHAPRRGLHPKDQEMYIQSKDDTVPGGTKPKKGRRKLKPWKISEKEPETNVAEGRRVFESRRRVHMANKQINPQHWADILARVRGRNPPKGTEVPQVLKATTLPSGHPEVTSIWPAAPPPSGASVWTTTSAEESSGDLSLFGEEEQVAGTVFSPGMVLLDPGPQGVTVAAPQVTSIHPEELIDEDFTEKGKDAPATEVDLGWAPATTSLSVPHESAPTVQTLAAVGEEPTHGSLGTEGRSTPDAGSVPEPTSNASEPPSSAIPHAASKNVPYAPSEPETQSPQDENEMNDLTSSGFTAAPTLGVADSRTFEPFEDHSVRETLVPAQTFLQGHSDTRQLVSNLSTQAHPRVRQGSQEDPQTVRKEGVLDRDPANFGNPENRRQGQVSSTLLDAALEVMSNVTAWKHPKETTRLDEAATTVAMLAPTQRSPAPSAPTTHPSRRRPHGKKRVRTHRLRQRQKQPPPTTLAPVETFSTPPTRVPEGAVPKQGDSLPVPTPWLESTVHTPPQLDAQRPSEPVPKEPPRKKHGKRPNKHRYVTATASPTASVSPTSPFPENKGVPTPTSQAVLPATTVSLPTVDLPRGSRVEGDSTTRVEIRFSPDQLQEASPLTHKPVLPGKEVENLGVANIDDYKTGSPLPGESVGHTVSPLGATVSSGGEFKEASKPSGFPGTPGWNLPGAAQPEELLTDRPAPGSSEAVTDSPFFQEGEGPGFPSEFAPSVAVSTMLQPEEWVPSLTLPGLKVEASSSPAETSISDQSDHAARPATLRPEGGPQPRVSPPVPVQEPTSPLPPTTLASLAHTTAQPAPLTSKTSPASSTCKENLLSGDGRTPETTTPSVKKQGTQPTGKPDRVSTPSPVLDKWNVTPKPVSGKEARDGRTESLLPRLPESRQEAGRAQVFQPPPGVPTKPVPSRETVRPPQTTQSSLRYFVTFQPPRHTTNRPEMTAHPSRVPLANERFTTPTLPGPTSPVVPLHGSKPSAPGTTTRGPHLAHGSSTSLGDNHLPDLRAPAGKLPHPRAPPASGRLPFFLNRTLSFPPLGVTPKPPTPASPALVMRDQNVNPGPSHRIHSQSIAQVDLGPPAPPLLPAPRTTAPPSTNVRNLPAVFSTRSSVPSLTPSAQPSRSVHHSSLKLFSAAGPPASKFWTLGEKPHIVTKSPPSVTVTAETDVVFPCEATGQPQPFVTWTKVSTGALMTPNTRVQRFEVLKNGTFVIRNVQVQDGGQYMCTAKNLHGADRMVVLLTVAVQQPQILASHYKDVTVYLGDTIAMECLAKGTPAPQISWIFPDRRVWQAVSPVEGRITLHENRTLSIKEASFSDRGVYKCVASNAAGADSLAIRLHVAALPPVIQQEKLENISVPPGLSIHIHCTAKAAPLPSVRWVLWDGTQIRPSQFLHGNLFVFPNGTLYIRNLAPKDSGRYECVAANLVGSARRAVQLSVMRAAANARITGTSPQRTDVRYGGTLRLDCSASGDPWPRILWRLPSKRMIDALFSFDTRMKVFANGTLLVKSVTDKDAGDYLCVARNKVGDDFVMLQVNVVMRPAKIEHKEENDHRVFYGGDLKVDCVATGLPNPEISWSLPDGSLVNSFMQSDDGGGRAKRYVVFNNGTLYFNEVGMREEGDYTCVAENQVGKDEMTVHVKVVTEPPAIRNKTYSVVQVPYGDVVTVACEAKGEPTPRVTWLSPTNRLIPASSEKYQIYPDGTLLIQKAQRSDSGNYTCVVRNSAGEDRKMVWILVHVQAPRINGNPDAITTVREIAPVGSRKLIDCQAEGTPMPRVLWAFPEGVVLPAPYHGNRITIHGNGTLDIRRLRKSDSVQLVCIGRNEGGEARLIVQLTVLEPVEKPIFHDPVSEKITAMAGHTISLNCSAAGTPTPTLLWVLPNRTELRSGQQLQRFYHKGDGKLHISDLSSVDAGAYRCVARNSAGYTERLVSLKVGLKPETSNRYHNLISIINGETLHLPCAPPGGRQARSSWTLPNGLVLEGPQARGRFTLWENGTLTVRDASVFDRGTYVCKADTEYGPSVANVPVIVIAYPPRITSEPTPVIYTRPGNMVKLNCMVMAIPKAEITWELPDKSLLMAGTQPRLYGHRFLHPQGSLTIQQATQRDAGFYKCSAKNILGSDSKTTYIHVY